MVMTHCGAEWCGRSAVPDGDDALRVPPVRLAGSLTRANAEPAAPLAKLDLVRG